MIRFFTAGESHNKALMAFIDGLPAGIKISEEKIKQELIRRKKGYGRGNRQVFEEDKFEIISGVRYNETIGSPICVLIYNTDYRTEDFVGTKNLSALTNPRPGHADLSGLLKFLRKDTKDISERASARETAARVVIGSICKQFLENFNIFIGSFVNKIYKIVLEENFITTNAKKLLKLHTLAEKSQIRFPCLSKEQKIIKLINKVKSLGDTIGGEFVVFALNVPVGLGSHTQWDLRLNVKVSSYIMSIPAIKSIEIGLGKNYSNFLGSQVHDEIFYSKESKKFFRKTNNAGGIEGGISNGEPIVVRACMKPIPTLFKPLKTTNIITKRLTTADIIRSDVLGVIPCSVVAENMLAICLTEQFLLKFGGDSLKEVKYNYKSYIKALKKI